MTRGKKTEGNGSGPTVGHNGLNDLGKGYVQRIEVIQTAIEFEQAKAKEEIAPLRSDIKDILEEAKSNGITKKAIKAVVKARALARKADRAREDLDIADRDTFDNIRHALGDLAELPLGQAALDHAQPESGAEA